MNFYKAYPIGFLPVLQKKNNTTLRCWGSQLNIFSLLPKVSLQIVSLGCELSHCIPWLASLQGKEPQAELSGKACLFSRAVFWNALFLHFCIPHGQREPCKTCQS